MLTLTFIGVSMCKGNLHKEEELWNQILGGNRLAFATLFRRYYTPLLNYGLKLTSHPDLVKDSIQELFFTIWEQKKGLSEVTHVRSYLYTSFRRTLIRQEEVKKNRARRDRQYADEFLRELGIAEKITSGGTLKKYQRERLKAALKLLSDREQEAVFLKFYSGLTNPEVAQIMQVNKQSVYNYIYRAIQALKVLLTEAEEA